MPQALFTSSLRTSPPPPRAGLSSRNSWTPASRAPSRPARRATGCKRQIDLVLVLQAGPLGTDCVDTLRLLTSYGVAWLATSQRLSAEASSLIGRSMISVMSAFSELERGMIVQRVVAGVKKAQGTLELLRPAGQYYQGGSPSSPASWCR